jgi:hypothetical protein
MSYNSLAAQITDIGLANRITASVQKEAFDNANLGGTDYGQAIQHGIASAFPLMWPVCIATETPYESALAADHPNPGTDESVISDAMILAAVQVHWPPDPWPVTGGP